MVAMPQIRKDNFLSNLDSFPHKLDFGRLKVFYG